MPNTQRTATVHSLTYLTLVSLGQSFSQPLPKVAMHRSIVSDEIGLASCKCLRTPLLDLRRQRPSHQLCIFSVSKITTSDDGES